MFVSFLPAQESSHTPWCGNIRFRFIFAFREFKGAPDFGRLLLAFAFHGTSLHGQRMVYGTRRVNVRALLVVGLLLLLPQYPDSKTKAAKPPSPAGAKAGADKGDAPAYTAEGRLRAPADYRQWIYLTSGIDMSYSPKPEMAGHSMFDNVFVNPAAYREFLKTGTWPDKTVMVLEVRGAESKGSINKTGHFQGTEIMGFEVHVKDDARTPGQWAFYEFDNESPAEMVPRTATCYSCHEQHAAVATTFVQFYPTLLNVAREKHTFSAEYLKEEASAKQP
jgi:Cytochrome P460